VSAGARYANLIIRISTSRSTVLRRGRARRCRRGDRGRCRIVVSPRDLLTSERSNLPPRRWATMLNDLSTPRHSLPCCCEAYQSETAAMRLRRGLAGLISTLSAMIERVRIGVPSATACSAQKARPHSHGRSRASSDIGCCSNRLPRSSPNPGRTTPDSTMAPAGRTPENE